VINDEPVAATQVCRLINHAGSYLRDDGYAGEYGVEAPDDGRFDHPAERFGFSGTAPVFRAETFRRIGGFAPQFFAYNEDTDWCLRARLAGLRIMYDPNGTVHHRHSATSGGPQQARVRFLLERNRLLCLVRNAPDDLARHYVWRRIVEGPDQGIRRSLLQKLPWAAASRIQLRRLWVTSPRQVWEQWAGANTAWDEASKTG
jgi:GT2 family glycosyltransferase